MSEAAQGAPSDVFFFDLQAESASELRSTILDTDLTVAVVGLGYVGLPTALALSSNGIRVIGLEISPNRLEAIRSGDVDLISSDRERLRRALDGSDFVLTGDPRALATAQAVIVCVPTPVDAHRTPDLSAIRSACDTVVANAVAGQLIILTSTSYVGCARDLVARPLELRGFSLGGDVFVAYSPERIDPGNTEHPQDVVPRVLGGMTTACAERAEALISTFAPVHVVSSPEAAELTKLYENTFRAVNIALANEIEGISRVFDLDVSEVIDAASTKPFGFMPFRPGSGVGGHCIPCDPHYLLWQLRERRHTAPLIEQAMAGIASRPLDIVARASEMLSDTGRGVRGARILVVGVAYKAGVEDVRESPALEIIDELIARGANVQYVDPLVRAVRLRDGHVIHSAPPSADAGWDLAVVHVLQPATEPWWLAHARLVLDPGDRLRSIRADLLPERIELAEVIEIEPDPTLIDSRTGMRDLGELQPTGTVGR